jgi:hypothetical protein
MTASSEAAVPNRTSFPFTHKPNPLDRDRIVIPSGWDSWGKISILRDSFDSKIWAEAWEKDLESEESSTEAGARKLFTALVPDHSSKVSVCHLVLKCTLSQLSHSHPLCHLSIALFQNRRSYLSITTIMRRIRIVILAGHSRILQTWLVLLPELLVLWEAVASTCPVLSVYGKRWRRE